MVTITYSARKASVPWPEKKFCDTEYSFFDCGKLTHLGLRKLGRMVRNDEQLLAGLKELEEETFDNGAIVKACPSLATTP